MIIAECGMCQDLVELSEWKDGDHFICKICVEILSEIRQNNIKLEKMGVKPIEFLDLIIFDLKRDSLRIKKVALDD